MTPPLRIRRVQIHPLTIPMRLRFEHAAASREASHAVVVELSAEAPYAEYSGFGETLARRYVTGETLATVVDDINELFIPHLLEFRARSFAEAVQFAAELPALVDGRLVNAARCAVELALLDLAGRVFHRRLADAISSAELNGFEPPGCLSTARYSGIVVGRPGLRLGTALRAQRCYGLRDFKIKVGIDGWEKRLEQTHRILRGALRRGDVTLRADANCAWTLEEAEQAVPLLDRFGVQALEQPLAPSQDEYLPELASLTQCDLIVDESLLTIEDAEALIEGGGVRVLNVRVAKNGGLIPTLRIAQLALAVGLDVQLGCLVGETSILSAAGVAFLECCPQVRYVEGAYGRWLLRQDVTRNPVTFGRGGRMRPLPGYGLGVDVSRSQLKRLTGVPIPAVNL